ncbi:MAG: isoprenyl transferase [Gammaproteobacteria bacterium]
MTDTLPRHVAIIMDGNGRWAKKRKLPRIAGHRSGVETVRKIVRSCAKQEIEVLTLFAFSSENWKRPKREVNLLMQLFVRALQQEVDSLNKNNVRLRVIGDLAGLPLKLQNLISNAQSVTRENTGLTLVIAANYGGRWDMTQAMQQVAELVEMGKLKPREITADIIEEYLCCSDLPEPDLFIRTGGEQRISNYLLWQLAYTELYFTEKLWPEFSVEDFSEALNSFSGRQRRFGRTGEQVENA